MMMHIGKNRPLALLALVPMVWFSIEGAAYATAYGVEQRQRDRILKMAENLKVDPELLLDPAAFREKQRAIRAARREQLVQSIQTDSGPTQDVIAARNAVHMAASGDRLAATFKHLAELKKAIQQSAAGSNSSTRNRALALARMVTTDAADLARIVDSERRFLSSLPNSTELLRRQAKALNPLKRVLSRVHARLLRMDLKNASSGDLLAVAALIPEAPAESPRTSDLSPALDRIDRRTDTTKPREQFAHVPASRNLTPEPGPADLDPAPEGEFTTPIQDLANSLGGDPLAIFRYVRDNFRSELYHGVRKGAEGALLTMGGNDADLSALLVALLRASGIPARYRYSRVELAPERAMQMAGTEDIRIAGDAFASSGFSAYLHWSGTECRGLVFDHVYVTAHVPYSNYRGVPGPESKPMWVELDPWLVRHTLTEGSDLASQVPFDRTAHLSAVQEKGPLATWEDQLLAWARANGRECENLDFAMRRRVRDAVDPGYLPSTAPGQVLARHWEDVALPATMRTTLRLEVQNTVNQVLVSHDAQGYEVFGVPVSLEYVPATPADEDLVAAYGSIVDTPPYLLRLKPRLVADGLVLSEGASVGAGAQTRIQIRMTDPGLGTRHATHQIVAGATLSSVWMPGPVSSYVMNQQELRLTSAVLSGDELAQRSARLGLVVLGHLHDDADSMERISGLLGQVTHRQFNEGAACDVIIVSYGSMGVPLSMERSHYQLDIPVNTVVQYGIYDAANLPTTLKTGMVMMGLEGSHLERVAAERQLEGDGYSTVLALQRASVDGQSLITIDRTNAATVLPTLGLPGEVKESILDAAEAGFEVLTHEAPVSAAGFSNAVGYIAEHPLTGAGSYRVGKASVNGCEAGDGESGPAGEGNDPCSCVCEGMGSTVNLSSGNYYFTETDLVLPAVGIPVTFSRRYNSMQYASGSLGAGWIHNFEMNLSENPDGSVDYVNEEGLVFTFGWDGAQYVRPLGRYWYLEKSGSNWILRFKGGMLNVFGSDGKLVYQEDTNGNRIELFYSDGRLDHVVDATGRQALSFSYNASGDLEKVTDAANREVVFGHNAAGDLTSLTDVLGNTKTFTYDSAHRMIGKSDFNGNDHTLSYDSRGRCYRHENPLGGVKSVSYDYKHRRAVVADQLGRETYRTYNENGNPDEVIDPVGNRKQMVWDADGNKLSATDARGLVTSFSYDTRGNLETRSAPGEGTTTYSYDPQLDRVLTITDAENGTTTNGYDASGNLETTQDAQGNITEYSYQANGMPETITRPGAVVTALGYDPNGNLETLTDAEGGITSLGYNPAGHISSIEDPLTHLRTLEVDAKGRVEATIDPEGNRTEFTYDNEGNRLTMKDPDNNVTTFGYDAMNRLVSVTDALGNTNSTEYDLAGNVTDRIDARGFRTEYEYDSGGRLKDIVTPDGGVTSLGYCADVSASCSTCGSGAASGSATKACAVIDPEGNLAMIDFDEAGRPTKVTDPLGHETITAYDHLGRKTSVTDAEGKTTQYRYFPTGRLWQVEDAQGGITEYGYDVRGNRTMVRDANLHETHFEYDKMDRLTKEINPLGKETVFSYDAGGNRETKLDPMGNLIQYVHDSNRQLTDIIYPDLSSTHFEYDSQGRKTYEENQYSARSYTHDDLGRVETVTDEILAKTISYEYDQNGNRTKMVGPNDEETLYRYDALNRIRELVDPDGERTVFGHDRAGKRTSMRFPNGVEGTYIHDQASRLESIVYKSTAGNVLSSFSYTHDDVGNRLSKTFATGNSESYGYDDLHRLTSATYPSGRSVGYDYDLVGNRNVVMESWDSGGSENTTYTYSDFNQVLTTTNDSGTTIYNWDENGNLAAKENPSAEVTQYSYNFENRLVGILYPNLATNSFGYDPQGIRVRKEDSEGIHQYLIDQVSVLAEFDGVGTQKAWYNHNPQRIDEIVSQVQSQGKFFHLVDGLGSVYGLVDQGQVKVASYSYDAYGVLTDSQIQPGIQNPYLFTGREFDADSGWQYNRARYYLSGVGSWNREDPYQHTLPHFRYRYSDLSPVFLSDPSGMRPYGASVYSPEYNERVEAALARIGSTTRGRRMLKALEDIDVPIYPPDEPRGMHSCGMFSEYRGSYPHGMICWNPNDRRFFITIQVFFIMSMFVFLVALPSSERVLVHELGHALGFEDPKNICKNENPVAIDWDEPIRIF